MRAWWLLGLALVLGCVFPQEMERDKPRPRLVLGAADFSVSGEAPRLALSPDGESLWVVGRDQIQRYATRDGRLLSRRSVRLSRAAQAVSLLSGRALAVLKYPNDEIALFVEGVLERTLRFDMGFHRIEASLTGEGVLLSSKRGTFFIRSSDLLAGRKRRLRRVGDLASFLPGGGLAILDKGELRIGARSWTFPGRGSPFQVVLSSDKASVMVFFREGPLPESAPASPPESVPAVEEHCDLVSSLSAEQGLLVSLSTGETREIPSPYHPSRLAQGECRGPEEGLVWGATACPLESGLRTTFLLLEGEISPEERSWLPGVMFGVAPCAFRRDSVSHRESPRAAYLLDPSSGERVHLSLPRMPYDAVLSPNGDTLYVAFSGAVRRYSARSGRLLDPPALSLREISSVRFSPDGASLLVASQDALSVIDLASQRVTEQQEGGAELAIFGGEKYLLAVQNDALCARRRPSGGLVWCTPVPEGIERLELNDAGEIALWHGEFDEDTTRFSLESGRTLLDTEFRENKALPRAAREPWSWRDAPDGFSRLWVERNAEVFVRQAEGERRLVGSVTGVIDLAWLGGNRAAAVFDSTNHLSLFEVETGALLGRTGRVNGFPERLFWSPARPGFLWVQQSDSLSLWDIGARVRVWGLSFSLAPRDVGFASDGGSVAVAWEDKIHVYSPRDLR